MRNLTKEQLSTYLGEEEAKKYSKDLEKYNAGKKYWFSWNRGAWLCTSVWSVKYKTWDLIMATMMAIYLGIFFYYIKDDLSLTLGMWGSNFMVYGLFMIYMLLLFGANESLMRATDREIQRGRVKREEPSRTKLWGWSIFVYLPLVIFMGVEGKAYVNELTKPFDQKSHDAFEKALNELERPNPLQVLATGYRQPKEYQESKWYDFRWGKPFPYDFVLQKGVKRNFVDNNDSTITDTSLGLMWQDNKKVKTKEYRDDEIDRACSKLELANYNDWRVPTAYELMSLLDYNEDKTIDNPFKYEDDDYGYWSATHIDNNKDVNIVFYFDKSNLGFSNLMEYADSRTEHLRCVRDTKERKPLRLHDFIEDVNRQVVLDQGTSLMWQNEPYSKYAVWTQDDNMNYSRRREFGKYITEEHALEYCEDLKLGGYNDWYMPNMQQRIQLNDFLNYPEVKVPFKKMPTSKYSTLLYYPYIHESTGYYPKAMSFVRCVRDAKVWKWDEE